MTDNYQLRYFLWFLSSFRLLFPYTCPVYLCSTNPPIVETKTCHLSWYFMALVFVNEEDPSMPNLLFQFSMDSCFQGRVEHLRSLATFNIIRASRQRSRYSRNWTGRKHVWSLAGQMHFDCKTDKERTKQTSTKIVRGKRRVFLNKITE